MTAHLAVEAAASKLPAGWAVESFRRLAAERGTRNSELVERSLSLSSTGLLYDRTEETDRQFASEQSARNARVVLPGDLVVNPMWLFGGAIGVSDRRGAVSPDYRVYNLSPRLEPRFVHHLLRSSTYRDQYRLYMRAETTFDRRITKDDFNEMPLVVPPRRAQLAIAAYFDAETTRIDDLIELRRRILGLFAERRRLATDRMLADSPGGVAWPVVKLKYVVRGFVDTLHATAPEEDDGPGFIVGTACIKSGSLNLAVARRCSTETLREWTKRALPQPGDVLLTREAPAGEAALVPAGIELAPGQRVVLVQTDRHRMLPELVLHSIYSARAGRFFDQLGRETTVAHLNMADIGELPVMLPPLNAQPVVAARIRAELGSLDQASSTMSRQIELLLERRQALITAAVTGQLDIPGVAA